MPTIDIGILNNVIWLHNHIKLVGISEGYHSSFQNKTCKANRDDLYRSIE